MNIFERLRQDHEVQRHLLQELLGTQGNSAKREECFGSLKAELTAHAAAEERYFYIPLIESDLTQDKARHSVAEHHEIDEIVEQLEQTDFSSPGWLVQAKHLSERVTHHLDEEEHEVFQMAGKVLAEQQKLQLAKDYSVEIEAQRESA